MSKPKKESFKVSSVKLLKDGGLDCHYEKDDVDGSDTFVEKNHIESPKDVHPDLRKKFNELRMVLARVYHLTFFTELMGIEGAKFSNKQEEIAVKLENEILDKINILGIKISGQEQNIGVVISGTFLADNKQKMAISTHRMKYTDSRYGFEEELERIVHEIKDEVYEFLFNGKRAQLSIFGESDFDGKAEAAGSESRELDNAAEVV